MAKPTPKGVKKPYRTIRSGGENLVPFYVPGTWNPERKSPDVGFYSEEDANYILGNDRAGEWKQPSLLSMAQDTAKPWHSYIKSGKEGDPQVALFWDPTSNRTVEVPEAEAQKKVDEGWEPLTPEQKSAEFKRRAAQGEGLLDQTGLATVATLASGAGALSLGATDVLARAFGVPGVAGGEETSQALQDIKKAKPYASFGAGVTGTLASALSPYGPLKAAGDIGAKGLSQVAARLGSKAAVAPAARVSVANAIGPVGVASIIGRGIAEGTAMGAGQAVTNISETPGEIDPEKASKHLIGSAGSGALIGAAFGSGGLVIGRLGQQINQVRTRRAAEILKQIEKDAGQSLEQSSAKIANAQVARIEKALETGIRESPRNKALNEALIKAKEMAKNPEKLAEMVRNNTAAQEATERMALMAKDRATLTAEEAIRLKELDDILTLEKTLAGSIKTDLAFKVATSPLTTGFVAGVGFKSSWAGVQAALGMFAGNNILSPAVLGAVKWVGGTTWGQKIAQVGLLAEKNMLAETFALMGHYPQVSRVARGFYKMEEGVSRAIDPLLRIGQAETIKEFTEISKPVTLTPGQAQGVVNSLNTTTAADVELDAKKALAPLPEASVAPIIEKEIQKYNYLKEKTQSLSSAQTPSVFGPQTPVISSENRVKLSRYVQATVDPASITAEFANQELTPESVETARTLYPEEYGQFSQFILEAVQDAVGEGKKYTLKEKQQINLLLGTPQTTTQPPLLLTQQSQNPQDGGQKKKTPKAPKDLDMAVMGRMQKSLSS